MKPKNIVFKAIAIAMGVSALVLSILGNGSTEVILLSIGVICLAIVQLQEK